MPLSTNSGKKISIHAPREECDIRVITDRVYYVYISIHAPREECDEVYEPKRRVVMSFQSTHPVRSATDGENAVPDERSISIHAPREECDEEQRRSFHRN